MNAAVQSRWSYNVVDDAKTVEKSVEDISSNGNSVLGLGVRTFNLRISIILIGAWDNEKGRGVVYIFDIVKMKGIHQVNTLLTSPDIIKVIHGCREANAHLETQFNLHLVNVFDTQVAYSVIKSQRDGQRSDQVEDISLNDLCAEYGVLRNSITDALQEELKTDPAQWRRRPFTNAMKELSLIDTLVLVPLYMQMNPLLNDNSVFYRLIAKQLSSEDEEKHEQEKIEIQERENDEMKEKEIQKDGGKGKERGGNPQVEQRNKKGIASAPIPMRLGLHMSSS